MALRITNGMMADRVLADLQRGYRTMARTQEQISSGLRVNRPSDDPVAAGQARLRQGELDGIDASKKSISAATEWLSGAETGLSSISSILSRAKELAVQGANGAMSAANRNQIADEIDQLIASAKDAVNARVGDTYIFSGTATTTAPYTSGTGDAYQGDSGQVLRDIGAGVTLQVNPQLVPLNPSPPGTSEPLTARAVLGDGATGPDADGDGFPDSDGRVLGTLRDLARHLRGGTATDLQALRTTDLQALDANVKAVADARSAVGAAQNRADAAAGRLEDLEAVGTQALTELTGTDFVKALTDFNAQYAAYQTALKAGATLIQPSLMDFLR